MLVHSKYRGDLYSNKSTNSIGDALITESGIIIPNNAVNDKRNTTASFVESDLSFISSTSLFFFLLNNNEINGI